jgi:hypothetical protein
MSQKHTVTITIKPGGEIETTVEGIDGPACESETSWLDNLGTVVKHERTADYYANVSHETVNEQVTTGTGEGGSHGSPW